MRVIDKILYGFYLLAFTSLIVLAIAQFITGEEIFLLAIIIQLIWAPIALIHLVVKLIMHLDKDSLVSRLYKFSFGISIAYFVLLFLVASSNMMISQHDNKLLGIAGVMLVPWLMLLFFVYILHKDLFTTAR